jgi:8-oxo-dGTP pyrophosphatase MutT (NUDIX family)
MRFSSSAHPPKWTLDRWRTALTAACKLEDSVLPVRPAHLSVYSHSLNRFVQREWFEHRPDNVKAEPKRSAILFLFSPSEALSTGGAARDPVDLVFPLEMRSAKLRAHAGQMALPGGRCDPGESEVDAAVRESQEEIGADPKTFEILGSLPRVWSYPGECWVTPIVGLSPTPLMHRNNSPAEVESLYYGRLDPLLFHSEQTHFRIEKFYSQSWGGNLTMPCFIARGDPALPLKRLEEGTVPTEGIKSIYKSGSDELIELERRIPLEAITNPDGGLVWGLTAMVMGSLLSRLAQPSVCGPDVVSLRSTGVVFADPAKTHAG